MSEVIITFLEFSVKEIKVRLKTAAFGLSRLASSVAGLFADVFLCLGFRSVSVQSFTPTVTHDT